jgi:hypothetical protein
VSVVSSSRHAIFVAPSELKIFDGRPGPDAIAGYAGYRPQRILVMAPPAALGQVEEQWAGFSGNPGDATAVASMGDVANVDLPALVILKMIVDRRLIEAGLWNEAQIEIRAASGSRLVIRAEDDLRIRIVGWIREIASAGPPAEMMTWAREAAFHRLGEMLPDLQSLVWQRDRPAALADVQTVTAAHVQDVARIYFE